MRPGHGNGCLIGGHPLAGLTASSKRSVRRAAAPDPDHRGLPGAQKGEVIAVHSW